MKTPAWIKVLAIISFLAAILGLILLFKIPGNIALVPFVIALTLAFIAFVAARKKNSKCYLVYLVFILSTGGIIYQLSSESTTEVVKDEVQEQILEDESKAIEDEELDDLLGE